MRITERGPHGSLTKESFPKILLGWGSLFGTLINYTHKFKKRNTIKNNVMCWTAKNPLDNHIHIIKKTLMSLMTINMIFLRFERWSRKEKEISLCFRKVRSIKCRLTQEELKISFAIYICQI